MELDLNLLLALWESSNWVVRTILVLVALHPIASAIVALTPTPKDDAIYAKIRKAVIEPLALHVFKAKTPTKSQEWVE